MMNVAVIMSLRGLPLMAKEGLSLIFYLAFAAFFFLIPISLVSAELATGWPDGGGVFRWVKEAFGSHAGFTAIFLQWIQNVVWYSTILSFAAGALAYFFLDPALSQNKIFVVSVILIIYWGATFLNFKGLKMSGMLSTIAVIAGTLLPGVFIILLGAIWFFSGSPLAFMENLVIVPDFSSLSNLSFLAGILLLFAGMEVSSVHALEVKNPKKDYPKAILLSVLITLIIFFLGSLAVAAVIPGDKIQLTTGLMQAFHEMLIQYKMEWMLPILGLLIALGAIGGVVAWIIGPSKGLLRTAKDGDLPPILAVTNKKGVPVNILFVQGGVVTLLSLIFLFAPNVGTAFFILTALTVILYLIMYLLLYSAAIHLRYKYPKKARPYKIPGGNIGMWIVSGVGIIAALFGIILGFIPPTQLKVDNPAAYVWFLAAGTLFFVALPIIFITTRTKGSHDRKK